MKLATSVFNVVFCAGFVFAEVGHRQVKVEGAPFDMPAIAEPVFPQRDFPITRYGAKPDGTKCPADGFRFENIRLESARKGFMHIVNAKNVEMKNVTLGDGPVLTYKDGRLGAYGCADTGVRGSGFGKERPFPVNGPGG